MDTVIEDNLFAPEIIADPYSYFGNLREEDPIHWNEKFGQWIITRHDDVSWGFKNPKIFSSELLHRDTGLLYPPIASEDQEHNEYIRSFTSNQFLRQDPPKHTGMRRSMDSHFYPQSMNTWRTTVRQIIDELLDAAVPKGHMDFLAEFGVSLPLQVICRMMGVPQEDMDFIKDSTNRQLMAAREGANRMAMAAQGNREMAEYLMPLMDERAIEPKNDLLTMMVTAAKEGIFDREELAANAVMMMTAGHETTANFLTNSVLAFIRHPDQWHLFTADPDGMANKAVEECLRYDPVLKGHQRITAEDVEVRGKQIKTGDRVRFIISSANRDPRMFDNPDKLDITRWPNRHLGFGVGVHHCIGANLARMEGQETYKALAERFESIHLQDENLSYQATVGFRALTALPITWTNA